MDWQQYRLEVDARELKVREESSEPCPLSYTGQFTRYGYILSSGKNFSDGELWEFTTKYKYMSKLANVVSYNGKCLVGHFADKMERCLELGCDWGHCFSVFENFFDEVYGIEAMALTAERGRYEDKNITLGVMENMPYEDDYFDVVMSNHVLEHGIDSDVVLSEIYRVTKVDGWSVHTIPCTVNEMLNIDTDIHSCDLTYPQWLSAFVKNGFYIVNAYFSWNHNQEEYNIIARKPK